MRIRTSTGNQSRRTAPNLAISFAKGVAITSIGILLSLPFTYALIYDQSTGYLSLLELVTLPLFLVGGPTTLFGLIVTFNRDRGQISQSLADMDIARIRHNVETESMRRK